MINTILKTYHSALRDEMNIPFELNSFSSNGNIAFKHDLTTGIHPEFKKAKAICSDIAWRAGFEKFMLRAGKGGTSNFNKYLTNISETIRQLKVPTFLIIGKNIQKILHPDKTVNVIQHGFPVLLGTWNENDLSEFKGKTNFEVMDIVCRRYDNILNFSCGYGNIAKYAIFHGKHFICSDVNGKCIYYLATTYMGYRRNENENLR